MASNFDAHKNLAYSLVATAPSPATSGTSLVVTAAQGTRFPTAPFNATICAAGATPTPANSEIVRVTAVSTDTLTIVRAQEGSSARTVVIGDQIFAGPTIKAVTDLEQMFNKNIFNVINYGAKGDNSTDDTTAIQAAIDAAGAVGGTVIFPNGTYKISAALKLYTGATPTITAYQGITLQGSGSNGAGFGGGAFISQITTGLDIIKGLNDVANGAQSINITIRDLTLLWGTATLTNSGNGIYLSQQAANGPSFQGILIENVVVVNCQGSGKYGFNFESLIASTVQNCQTNSCANGFYLNGQAGGAFSSVCTSVAVISCFANMSTNGVNGYNVEDSTYISFVACAADYGVNSTGTAYLVGGSTAVSFYGCGCELASVTLTNMWKIGGDAATNASNGVGLYNCYSFQSKSSIDILVTAASTQVTIIGHSDNSSVSGSTGLKVDAGAQASEQDCNWGTVATPRNINATGVWYLDNVPRVVTVASSATPVFNTGAGDVFNLLAQASATNVTSMTTSVTGTPIAGQRIHLALQAVTGTPTITWGTLWEASTVALPTGFTTTRVDCDFIWNAATSKWRIINKV